MTGFALFCGSPGNRLRTFCIRMRVLFSSCWNVFPRLWSNPPLCNYPQSIGWVADGGDHLNRAGVLAVAPIHFVGSCQRSSFLSRAGRTVLPVALCPSACATNRGTRQLAFFRSKGGDWRKHQQLFRVSFSTDFSGAFVYAAGSADPVGWR